MLIAITTDFGLTDNFVGVMKGVIAGIAPDARTVDVSHAVPPQDIAAGAFVLATAYQYFPAGTIHLAIVDPGVGSARRPIALEAGGYRWVAPDNGLLGYAFGHLHAAGHLQGRWADGVWTLGPDARAVELAEPRYWLPHLSRTFHGRDLFAPIAAHLAAGVPLDALGPPLRQVQALAWPRPTPLPDGWEGTVLYVDRYGNLIASIGADVLAGADWQVEIGGARIDGLSTSYSAMGAVGALVGSADLLEISVPGGSAAARLGAGVGSPVRVHRH